MLIPQPQTPAVTLTNADGRFMLSAPAGRDAAGRYSIADGQKAQRGRIERAVKGQLQNRSNRPLTCRLSDYNQPDCRPMPMNTASVILVLTLASSAFAQSPAIEIRVTGEHTMAGGDTPDWAKQFALVDATRKAWQQTVTRLQDLAEVKALQLKPIQLDAYAAALVETQQQSERTTAAANRSVYQVDVLVRLDGGESARRLGGLRKDQDASSALVELWKQMQELQQQLGDQTQRLAGLTAGDASQAIQVRHTTLTRLRVKHLAAQVTAALAKTEENPAGGRMASIAGRDRARQLAEAALALAPDSPDAHYGMGDVLMDALQGEAAEAEYRKALLGSPDSSSGHIKLANALRYEGRTPEAVAELREALRLDPNSVLAHSDLGFVLRGQRNLPDAISEYQAALRLDPDFGDAHNGLAIALAGQGQVAEAVAEFREMIRVDADSAVGYYNLASALADLDKDEESAAALREVVRINPNHYNAHYNLGELFRLEGKFDESGKQFREYLRLAPDAPQNQRNIQRAKGFIKSFENP
jgi:tetratricopeptide (TPR) repeat protein